MKIDNIRVGQVFSNYKALCNALEIPATGGKAKLLVLKKLESFFTLERFGNSIKIAEFISQEQVNMNLITSMSHRSLCELLLMDYFYRHIQETYSQEVLQESPEEIYSIVLSKRQIDLITGLVNNLFSSIKNLKSGKMTYEFARYVRAKNWEIIKDVLWNLGNKKVAFNYRTFYAVTITDRVPKIMSPEEAAKILNVYQLVMTKQNRKSIQQIFFLKELPEYYESVRKALYELHQITFHDECFIFHVSLQTAENYLLSKIISLNAMSDVKIEVNNRHIENLFNFFQRQYERFLRLQETNCQGFKTEYYEDLEPNFVEHNSECLDKFIKLPA